MPELDFDGERLHVWETPDGKPDWSVPITDYELRQVASTLPFGKSLPVALRGGTSSPFLVLVPTVSDMGALVALARMREGRTGPAYPDTSDAPEEDAGPLRRPLNTEECAALRRAVHQAAPAGLGPNAITAITGHVLATLRDLVEEA